MTWFISGFMLHGTIDPAAIELLIGASMADVVQRFLGRKADDGLIDRNPTRVGVSFDLGVVQYFGGSDFDNNSLVSGWATPEPEHNWNDGCETVFQALVENPRGACFLEVQGLPFINDKCPRQDIILHLNGFRIGYWRLTKPSFCALTAKIEPEQLFSRGDLMLMKLIWSFPDSVSPVAKNLSNDTRELAFCFRSILVKRVDPG